jgi:hypothetical protein
MTLEQFISNNRGINDGGSPCIVYAVAIELCSCIAKGH